MRKELAFTVESEWKDMELFLFQDEIEELEYHLNELKQSLSQSNSDLAAEEERATEEFDIQEAEDLLDQLEAQNIFSQSKEEEEMDQSCDSDEDMDQSDAEEEEDPELNESHDLDRYMHGLSDSKDFNQSEATPEPTQLNSISSEDITSVSEDQMSVSSVRPVKDEQNKRTKDTNTRKVRYLLYILLLLYTDQKPSWHQALYKSLFKYRYNMQ